MSSVHCSHVQGILLPACGSGEDVTQATAMRPQGRVTRRQPHTVNRYKVRRTGAPDSHHPVLTPWTSRKEALLMSQAASNPYHHCSPPEVWRHQEAGQHSRRLHKSINVAIRCQRLMTATSTSALGMVSPSLPQPP